MEQVLGGRRGCCQDACEYGPSMAATSEADADKYRRQELLIWTMGIIDGIDRLRNRELEGGGRGTSPVSVEMIGASG